MNKIIEEFAVQAKKFAIEQLGHPHDPTLFSARVFQEKFAELIVKECGAQVFNTELDDCCSDSDVLCAVSFKLKKHFGVEE